MKYILKTLDESVKQSENIEDLNNGCIFYKTMKSYMDALPEAQNKNPEFFNLLVNQCYVTEESEVNEPLTPERIQNDIQFVNQNVSEYYNLIQNSLREKTR